MKTLVNSKLNQALFFLAIAMTCTVFASCKDKDSCQKCAEERAAEESKMAETATPATDSDTLIVKEPVSTSATKTTQKATTKSTSNKDKESDENVSIINPNDKSNSDSKRTYGSSGTSGGSGTSGSGGDGNGSTGWNDGTKDKTKS